jgi:hypothetical protein
MDYRQIDAELLALAGFGEDDRYVNRLVDGFGYRGAAMRLKSITVPVPEWLGELEHDEYADILLQAEKSAVDAWESKLDTFFRVLRHRKEVRDMGQTDLYDYV